MSPCHSPPNSDHGERKGTHSLHTSTGSVSATHSHPHEGTKGEYIILPTPFSLVSGKETPVLYSPVPLLLRIKGEPHYNPPHPLFQLGDHGGKRAHATLSHSSMLLLTVLQGRMKKDAEYLRFPSPSAQ